MHAAILVPYHGWRISHRTHHAHHGHVENDESWTPVPKARNGPALYCIGVYPGGLRVGIEVNMHVMLFPSHINFPLCLVGHH